MDFTFSPLAILPIQDNHDSDCGGLVVGVPRAGTLPWTNWAKKDPFGATSTVSHMAASWGCDVPPESQGQKSPKK